MKEAEKRRDAETRRRGDAETRRRKQRTQGRAQATRDKITFLFSPRLRVSASPRLRFIPALLACVLFFAASALAQTGGARKNGDARARVLLDQLGYKYELTVDGDFKLIPIKTEDGRSQLVYVNSNTQQYGTLEIREVMSPAYLSNGPLSSAVANRLLRENSEVKFGAWRVELHNNGQKYLALFAVQIAANADAETLRLAIKSVLLVADRMEKELTGTDDY